MASTTVAILTPSAPLVPDRGTAPIAANQLIPKSTIITRNASGYAVSPSTADTSGFPALGVSNATYDNRTSSAMGGNAGDGDAEYLYGPHGFAYTGTAPIVGDRLYVVDNKTLSTSDGGGTRGFAGVCTEVRTLGGTALAFCNFTPGVSADGALTTARIGQFKARGAAYTNHSLTAFTVATNTDGITYVAGDIVLLTAQTTPAENGPYVVGTVATTAPLTRPSWWTTGAAIQPGQVIEVSEGTLFAGSSWKALCGKAKVVGTDDPVLYPRVCKGTVTLASGTKVLGSTQGLFLRSTTASPVLLTRNTFHAGSTTTVGYDAPVANRTAGVAGTAALSIFGCAAAGTHPGDDASDVDFQVTNW